MTRIIQIQLCEPPSPTNEMPTVTLTLSGHALPYRLTAAARRLYDELMTLPQREGSTLSEAAQKAADLFKEMGI